MNDRDPRWKNVWASVGPSSSPFAQGEIEFRIEVMGESHRVGQVFRADLRELAMPGAYAYILDKMVRELDEAIRA